MLLLVFALLAGDRATETRLRNGENEHLIYYVLQSTRFTAEPPIEPALCARNYVQRGAIPAVRIRDFTRALPHARGERMQYFRELLAHVPEIERYVTAEYRRVMRSLYEKEFGNGNEWYQSRGHSSDTSIESGYGVFVALSIIRELDSKARIEHVLIVGPGVDFAPRTGLREDAPPRSYQPFTVADAIKRLGMAPPGRARVHCVDINQRVLDTIRAQQKMEFTLTGSDPGLVAWAKSLPRHVPTGITVERLDILLERSARAPFDAVVSTNVLLYFDDEELQQAAANIRAMLKPGGYWIHNEVRPSFNPEGMSPLHGRTVRLSDRLYDQVVIHKKAQ
jgi:hypothetical protein